jgi:hypothetical protein
MKRLIFGTVLLTAFVISACDQTAVNNPVEGSDKTTFMKALDQLQLSNDQCAQLDEFFYLDMDMSSLLTPQQERLINIMANSVNPHILNDRMDRRRALDLAAMIYYRLIVMANSDLPEETKMALRELIAASNQARLQIILENKGNPEVLKQLLAAEHARLIEAMNALLTPDQLIRVQELKDKIELDRKDRRDKWIGNGVDRYVDMLTRWLELTPDQAEQIKVIMTNQQAQIEALRMQYAGNPEGFRAALMELQAATNAAIVALLDKVQLEKWNRLMHPRW